MKEIVQDGADVLRQMAKPVLDNMFGSAELTALIKEMSEALDVEPDGVALAAPQVNEPLRLFIVRMDRVEPPPPLEAETPPAPRAACRLFNLVITFQK